MSASASLKTICLFLIFSPISCKVTFTLLIRMSILFNFAMLSCILFSFLYVLSVKPISQAIKKLMNEPLFKIKIK